MACPTSNLSDVSSTSGAGQTLSRRFNFSPQRPNQLSTKHGKSAKAFFRYGELNRNGGLPIVKKRNFSH